MLSVFRISSLWQCRHFVVWVSRYLPELLLLDSNLFGSEQKPWDSDGFFSTRWRIDSEQVYDIVTILSPSSVAFRNRRILFIQPKVDLLFFLRFLYGLPCYLKVLQILQLFPSYDNHIDQNNKAIISNTLIIGFRGKKKQFRESRSQARSKNEERGRCTSRQKSQAHLA
jgi:hypothetical protein